MSCTSIPMICLDSLPLMPEKNCTGKVQYLERARRLEAACSANSTVAVLCTL